MAALTRKQGKEYIRIKCKELKNDALVTTFLNAEVNLSRRKVQKDVMAVGLKNFTRQAFLEGAYPALPTDIMDLPDAVVDIKCATGVRASVTTAFTGVNNDITFTVNEPGTAGNRADCIVMSDGLAPGASPSITVVFTSELPVITIFFAPGETSADIISAVNAHNIASLFITAANASGNDGTGTITIGVSIAYTTTGGTGTGFFPADEISIEQYNRINDVSLMAPSYDEPRFAIVGDLDKTRLLQFLPKAVTWSWIYYKFIVADLTADTDILTKELATDWEELILLDMLGKAWELLENGAEEAAKKGEYANEKEKYRTAYQNALQAKIQEKIRMETTDKTN